MPWGIEKLVGLGLQRTITGGLFAIFVCHFVCGMCEKQD